MYPGTIRVRDLLRHAVRSLWWCIRGVGDGDYRALCRRCGRTGQTHWAVRGCWRFKSKIGGGR